MVQGLLAMAPAQDPAFSKVIRMNSINGTCNHTGTPMSQLWRNHSKYENTTGTSNTTSTLGFHIEG